MVIIVANGRSPSNLVLTNERSNGRFADKFSGFETLGQTGVFLPI
jgi:hypothetical protein